MHTADPHERQSTPPDAEEWDARYAGDGTGASMWSGAPNGTLVAEVADLPPGRALDVGCGEGGDAIWLAGRGWQVTAIDPSSVALDRARTAAAAAGVEVTWLHAGLLDLPDGPGRHDLVTAQYPVLRKDPQDRAIAALLDAVAPGGTLLVVHHDLDEAHREQHRAEHGSAFDDLVMPDDVAAHLRGLGDAWAIDVHEVRERPDPPDWDHRHIGDVVLRARRR